MAHDHDHTGGHGHDGHSHGVSADADRGKLALGLILGFMAVEVSARSSSEIDPCRDRFENDSRTLSPIAPATGRWQSSIPGSDDCLSGLATLGTRRAPSLDPRSVGPVGRVRAIVSVEVFGS
jgi:hypothetical protein